MREQTSNKCFKKHHYYHTVKCHSSLWETWLTYRCRHKHKCLFQFTAEVRIINHLCQTLLLYSDFIIIYYHSSYLYKMEA